MKYNYSASVYENGNPVFTMVYTTENRAKNGIIAYLGNSERWSSGIKWNYCFHKENHIAWDIVNRSTDTVCQEGNAILNKFGIFEIA